MQVPEYKVSTLYSGTKVGTSSLCEHNFLFSLLSSCFKMASDRAKWSNYVDSLISGTQSVNTTPFCAGTQHQVWTQSLRDGRSIWSIVQTTLCYVNYCNPLFTAYKLITQTQDSSEEGLEGSRGNIQASPPNLKISYFVKRKKKKLPAKVTHINC